MKNNVCGAGGGAIYGIGVLGALVYFIQHSVVPLDFLLAILKAIFWPGVVLYKTLELLGM